MDYVTQHELAVKELSFDKITSTMQDLRESYLAGRDGKNSIFISDHGIVQYLKRVKRIKMKDFNTSFKTLMEWKGIMKADLVEIRKEILAREEMIHIVRNGLREYEKEVVGGTMIVVLTHLTVVTVYMKKEKGKK